jgi:CspA family cold shock protein
MSQQPSKAMNLGVRQGTVTTFNDTLGYGFIRPEGEQQDIFVHYSGIRPTGRSRRSLIPGQRVEFEVVREPGGGPKPMAHDVRVVVPTAGREAQG